MSYCASKGMSICVYNPCLYSVTFALTLLLCLSLLYIFFTFPHFLLYVVSLLFSVQSAVIGGTEGYIYAFRDSGEIINKKIVN